jgi:hypothetical protein
MRLSTKFTINCAGNCSILSHSSVPCLLNYTLNNSWINHHTRSVFHFHIAQFALPFIFLSSRIHPLTSTLFLTLSPFTSSYSFDATRYVRFLGFTSCYVGFIYLTLYCFYGHILCLIFIHCLFDRYMLCSMWMLCYMLSC